MSWGAAAAEPAPPLAAPLGRVLFVLGKGGVGRSTVAAALGSCFAARGERTLIVEWTLEEPIAPWFGCAAAGHAAVPIAERLSVMNYSLAETMREYFVGHLGMRRLHDRVIASHTLQVALRAAPGFQELFFLGRLSWLTTTAEEETGIAFDRIIVDAPASGHAASLLGLPARMSALGAGGLFGLELTRVRTLLGDPARTSALVVTLAEELASEETQELLPVLERELARRPSALFINRSAASAVHDAEGVVPPWLTQLGARLPAVMPLHRELLERRRRELFLRDTLGPKTTLGALALDDGMFADEPLAPRALVEQMAARLSAWLPA